jgi:hypothetical protein
MEDERYLRGQIYTIRNIKDDTMIYVGSTINSLSKRFHKHKCDCKNKGNYSLYSYIDNDWSDWYIELYEMYPCNNKKELERREGQVIREIGTINKNIAGRTNEEWREENADFLKEYKKKWREENPEKIKEWREDNKDKIKEKCKIYYDKNINYIKEINKKYREDNKDKIKKQQSEKVCCNICGAFSTKTNLQRHKQSKKCMEALNNTTSNIQDCE